MLEKITIMILLVSNVILWVSHFKMKMIIGMMIKMNKDTLEKIMEGLK